MRALLDPPRHRATRGVGSAERLWSEEPPARVAAQPAARESAVATTAAPVPVSSPATPTLDDLVSEAWAGLVAAGPVTCPVCSAPMLPRWSAGAGVVGGRCDGCASVLE